MTNIKTMFNNISDKNKKVCLKIAPGVCVVVVLFILWGMASTSTRGGVLYNIVNGSSENKIVDSVKWVKEYPGFLRDQE